MTWKNIRFRERTREEGEGAGDFAPRHVLYITAAFHMADVQTRVAAPYDRARASSAMHLHRRNREKEKERDNALQNLKLRRHRDVILA